MELCSYRYVCLFISLKESKWCIVSWSILNKHPMTTSFLPSPYSDELHLSSLSSLLRRAARRLAIFFSASRSLGLNRWVAVSADARINVLEALQLELGFVLRCRSGLHLDEFNSFLMGTGLLRLDHTFRLLLLIATVKSRNSYQFVT